MGRPRKHNLVGMKIPENQVKYRKNVGKVDDDDVVELGTVGGLFLHARVKKSGMAEILSTGPHPAVARFIARKHAPNIQWTSLQKGDHIDPEHFQHLLPRYEAMTVALRAMKK